MAHKKKQKNLDAEKAQRGAAAMANSTRGRARTYKDRRKEASKKACRGKIDQDS